MIKSSTLFILFAIFVITTGCDSNTSYSTSSGGSSSSSFYESDQYKNADSKVQEDVLIYDILRQSGYSESESRNAVINTMDQ